MKSLASRPSATARAPAAGRRPATLRAAVERDVPDPRERQPGLRRLRGRGEHEHRTAKASRTGRSRIERLSTGWLPRAVRRRARPDERSRRTRTDDAWTKGAAMAQLVRPSRRCQPRRLRRRTARNASTDVGAATSSSTSPARPVLAVQAAQQEQLGFLLLEATWALVGACSCETTTARRIAGPTRSRPGSGVALMRATGEDGPAPQTTRARAGRPGPRSGCRGAAVGIMRARLVSASPGVAKPPCRSIPTRGSSRGRFASEAMTTPTTAASSIKG